MLVAPRATLPEWSRGLRRWHARVAKAEANSASNWPPDWKGDFEVCGCGGHQQHGMGHTGHGYETHGDMEQAPVRKDDALDILKVRLAKGEITVEEYREMRDTLISH